MDGPKKRTKNSDVPGGFTFVDKDGEQGRRKIRIEYITDKSRRHITFSKRKAGIMKKVSGAEPSARGPCAEKGRGEIIWTTSRRMYW